MSTAPAINTTCYTRGMCKKKKTEQIIQLLHRVLPSAAESSHVQIRAKSFQPRSFCTSNPPKTLHNNQKSPFRSSRLHKNSLPLPSLPITFQHMHDLSMCHRILASRLQCRTIHKVEHDRVGQLLSIQVRHVWQTELAQRESLCGTTLVLHCLRDGEAKMSTVVDGDDAAFPELQSNVVSTFTPC